MKAQRAHAPAGCPRQRVTGGEAADHGAKALRDGGDGAAVGAVLRHAGVPVQQRIARHPHMVEPQLPIVHSIQTGLQHM